MPLRFQSAEQKRRQLCESCTGLSRRHVLRRSSNCVAECMHVRDADCITEKVDHRCVVWRVADKNTSLLLGVKIDAELLCEQGTRHGQLVIAAEPSVDVNRRYFGGHAF